MAQLMPLPLTVSCFSKIQTGFSLHPGSPGQRAVKRVCVSINDKRQDLVESFDLLLVLLQLLHRLALQIVVLQLLLLLQLRQLLVLHAKSVHHFHPVPTILRVFLQTTRRDSVAGHF